MNQIMAILKSALEKKKEEERAVDEGGKEGGEEEDKENAMEVEPPAVELEKAKVI